MLLTETKISDTVYCHNCLRYYVVFSKATVTAAGGGTGGFRIVLREKPEG